MVLMKLVKAIDLSVSGSAAANPRKRRDGSGVLGAGRLLGEWEGRRRASMFICFLF